MSKQINYDAYKLSPEKKDLVIKNMGLVRSIIRDRFSVYHEYYDDMLQEGTIGLIKAVAKHDPTKGAQLSTFAYFCIKNEIQKFVSECTDTIRVPVSVSLAINSTRRIKESGGTDEECREVLAQNAISNRMLEAGKTALATVSMDEENDEGLPYRDILPGKPDNVETLDDQDRDMYSNLHIWLNFNYPDELYHNRVYVNYLYLYSQSDRQLTEMYNQLRDDFSVEPHTVRKIVKLYTPRLRNFLSKRVNNTNTTKTGAI